MGIVDFKASVKGKELSILLCDLDSRTINAANKLKQEGIITPILVGSKSDYEKLGDVSNLEVIEINPDLYAQTYVDLRAKRNRTVSLDQAKEMLSHPAYFSTMLLYDNKAHGLVCGSSWPTGDTLKAAIHVLRSEDTIASSYFLMRVPAGNHQGDYLFADCAFNVQPNAEELAMIALNTAKAAENMGLSPKIALLSFSTYGSAKHLDQAKVSEAHDIVIKEIEAMNNDWCVTGEIQADAALVPGVASSKAPNCSVQGEANVLVFPDLDAGNIGYKLVQRFSDAQAIGPVLTGFTKPVNDLSRGCSVDDIVELSYVTAWQALGKVL